MSRQPRFSREQLQATALAIVDEQGLDGLSMRTLARALGTGPMTLYNYVATREDLDTLVVEAVAAGARWEAVADWTWEVEVQSIAKAVWMSVRQHPNTVPLVLTRRSRSPAALNVAEALMAALARAGLRDASLLIAFRSEPVNLPRRHLQDSRPCPQIDSPTCVKALMRLHGAGQIVSLTPQCIC
jgi:AcrR family transcriptional regulator